MDQNSKIVSLTATEKWSFKIILTHILQLPGVPHCIDCSLRYKTANAGPIFGGGCVICFCEACENIFLVHRKYLDAKNWSKSDWINFFPFTCSKSYRSNYVPAQFYSRSRWKRCWIYSGAALYSEPAIEAWPNVRHWILSSSKDFVVQFLYWQ